MPGSETVRKETVILRKPVRDSVQPALDRIKALIEKAPDLDLDDYSKKLRLELISLNRIRKQLSDQDNR